MDLFKPPVLDAALLSPMIRKLLYNPRLTVTEWECIELNRGSDHRAVYEVNGLAAADADHQRWTMILKVLNREDGDPQSDGAFYWLREPLVYTSGIFDELSTVAATPRCLGTTRVRDNEQWIWLEAIPDSVGQWEIPEYEAAARYLGRLNGFYAARMTAPPYDWVSRRLLVRWLENIEAGWDYLTEYSAHPFVRRMIGHTSPAEILGLTSLVGPLLRALDSAPQGFCHLDCHRRNFVLRSTSSGKAGPPGSECGAITPILVDWSVAGLAALGQDLGPLITVSYFMLQAHGIELSSLESAAFEAYRSGLRDVNCNTSEEWIRFAYVADAVLRFINRSRFLCRCAKHEDARLWWEAKIGRPIEDILGQYSLMLPHMLGLAREARKYLSQLIL